MLVDRCRTGPRRVQSVSPSTTAPYCQKQQARYFICRSCELIFQHPLPTAAGRCATWADAEYTSGAYHDYVAARPMKMRHFEQRFDDIGDVVKPGRLLDVGLFVRVLHGGGRGARLRRPGRRVFCGARSPPPTPAIRARIFEGTLEDMPVNGLFDVVSAFDLIEHVPDPTGVSPAMCRVC